MLELVSKRVVMLACVDAGCCCFKQVAAVNEVRESWANVIEQLHQPGMSHRTREGRVAARDGCDACRVHVCISAVAVSFCYTRTRARANCPNQ